MKLKNRNHKMTSDIQLLRLAFNGGLELVGESILEEIAKRFSQLMKLFKKKEKMAN